MEETNNISFGVTTETKSQNIVNFNGGFSKAFLVDVKKDVIGKGEEKYTVLNFKFIDAEGIRTFTHTEWVLDSSDAKFAQKMNGMNSRIKHLYETFNTFPTEGIGGGATSFEDFFDKVVASFDNNGVKIYNNVKEGKITPKLVWLKITYKTVGKQMGQTQFPLSPNFIELIKEDNQTAPKTLEINNRFDVIVQPKKAESTHTTMGNNTENFAF